MSFPTGAFLVFPADGRASSRPEEAVILFSSYTGGAHCCELYKLIKPTASGWSVTEIGEWDGSGPQPVDIDKDGRLELLAHDGRFDYRLASHAESIMPPVVYRLQDGQLIDVSTEPQYRSVFRRDLGTYRRYCEQSESQVGPCLGYVATAARAGPDELRVAMAVMDAHTEDKSDPVWPVPLHCTAPPSALECPDKPAKVLTNRHDAVVWILRDLGYLPPDAK